MDNKHKLDVSREDNIKKKRKIHGGVKKIYNEEPVFNETSKKKKDKHAFETPSKKKEKNIEKHTILNFFPKPSDVPPSKKKGKAPLVSPKKTSEKENIEISNKPSVSPKKTSEKANIGISNKPSHLKDDHDSSSSDDDTFVSPKSSKSPIGKCVSMKPVEQNESTDEEEDISKPAAEKSELYMGWAKEDLILLFDRMRKQIPKTDNLGFSSRTAKIDWNEIAFNNHKASDCQQVWTSVVTNIRKFRLLSEVLDDAVKWADTPWINFSKKKKLNHPDMPKKPVSAYFLFSMDKMNKIRTKHPETSMVEIAKLISEKYKALPEEKKAKYVQKADGLKQEYERKWDAFVKEHPTVAACLQKVKSLKDPSLPAKPNPPSKLYALHKFSEIKDSEHMSSKDLMEKMKDAWKLLPDKKKVHWIRKSLVEEANYLEELEQFKAGHADADIPQYKSVISRQDRSLIDKFEGKPEDPPMSAFAFFRKIMMKDPKICEKYVYPKDRMREIGKLWQSVSEEDKKAYAEKVQEMREEYLVHYKAYLDSLPEDKKMAELALGKLKRLKALNNSSSSRGKKMKQTSIEDLIKKTVTKETKKVDEKMNLKDSSEEESDSEEEEGEDVDSPRLNQIKQKLLMNEPPPPPKEPFLLFLSMYMTNPGAKEKKAYKLWTAMSDTEKDKYAQKHNELREKYLIKYQKFLKSLNAKEVKIYYLMKGIKKTVAQDDDDEDDNEDDEEDDDSQKLVVVSPKQNVPAADSSSSEESDSS